MSHAFGRTRRPAWLAAAVALVWLVAAPDRAILAADTPAIEVDRESEPGSSLTFQELTRFAQVASDSIGYFSYDGVRLGAFPTFGSGVITDMVYFDNSSAFPLVVTRSTGLEFYDANGALIFLWSLTGVRNTAYRGTVLYAVAANGTITTFPPQPPQTIPGVSSPVWFDIDGLNSCVIFYTTGGQRVRRYNLCTQQALPDLGTMPTGPVRNVRSLWDSGSIAVLTDSVVYVVDHGGRVTRRITTASLGETGSFSGLSASWPNSGNPIGAFLVSARSGNVYDPVQRILSTGFAGLSAATTYQIGQPSRVPIFDHSDCGTVHQLTVGQPFEAQIPVSSEFPVYYFVASPLPRGAHLVPRLPLPLLRRNASVKFRWTPTLADAGVYRVTFSLGDTMGHAVATCAHDFQVSPPPGVTVDAESAEPRAATFAEDDAAPAPIAEAEGAGRFELGPAWPSPASGSVHLRLRLDRARALRLSIVDLQGRERAVLYQGIQTPGDHELVWDGRLAGEGAVPGIYFLRCRSGDVELARKIVIGR